MKGHGCFIRALTAALEALGRYCKKDQGLFALVIAVGLFWWSPRIVNYFHPEDPGFVPGAYLQAIMMGVAIFFVGTWAAWKALQLDFKSCDKFLDRAKISNLIESINNPALKLCVLVAPFFLLLWWFHAALGHAVNLLK